MLNFRWKKNSLFLVWSTITLPLVRGSVYVASLSWLMSIGVKFSMKEKFPLPSLVYYYISTISCIPLWGFSLMVNVDCSIPCIACRLQSSSAEKDERQRKGRDWSWDLLVDLSVELPIRPFVLDKGTIGTFGICIYGNRRVQSTREKLGPLSFSLVKSTRTVVATL